MSIVGTNPAIIKIRTVRGESWETPRQPYHVTFSATVTSTAAGVSSSLEVVHSAAVALPDAHESTSNNNHSLSDVDALAAATHDEKLGGSSPLLYSAILGSGQLPVGLEDALSCMNAKEESVFVMPTMLLEGGGGGEFAGLFWPPLGEPTAAVRVALHSFIEVRDMAGDGQVCVCVCYNQWFFFSQNIG